MQIAAILVSHARTKRFSMPLKSVNWGKFWQRRNSNFFLLCTKFFALPWGSAEVKRIKRIKKNFSINIKWKWCWLFPSCHDCLELYIQFSDAYFKSSMWTLSVFFSSSTSTCHFLNFIVLHMWARLLLFFSFFFRCTQHEIKYSTLYFLFYSIKKNALRTHRRVS